MHRKPARCWQVPSEGSEFKCDPLPSRKGEGSHSLALQCVPVAGWAGELRLLDTFPEEGELLGREKAKGRWPLNTLGRSSR